MILSLGLAFLAVIITGISQILLKIGSHHEFQKKRFIAAYLNPYTLSAYGLLLFVTMISVIALMEIPLKMYYAIASLNFVVVTGLSWWILHEVVNKKIILGMLLIIGGILVFNL